MAAALCLLAIPAEVAWLVGGGGGFFVRGGPLLIELHSLRSESYAGVVA